MSRRIDHDEQDRDSSEYEDFEDEEQEQEEEEVEEGAEKLQFQTEYIGEQEGASSGAAVAEVPVEMNIGYEEVYPHNETDNPHDMVEAEKVYYENEMEDLVYHEIYGDGNEPQKLGLRPNPARFESASKMAGIRTIITTTATCLVCQRSESEKIRLFKWPKSGELKEQWLHFFRLPANVLDSVAEPYICCYHFSADTFVMMEDRIFWKMTAVPKYRHRRPGLAEPFPWEPAAKMKMEQQQMMASTSAASSESLGYKIRYRMPYNKYKTRNVHQVAVMIPVAQPNLYYEFHFNRHGLHNTKFYACLNCRKAKAESGIRDVIRTIHLDGNKFLSHGDPFNGHHFACRPHNIYDYKSSWRPIPGQNGEAHFLDEVVYVDERGNSLEWDPMTRPGEETTVKYEEVQRKDDEPVEMYENFEQPMCEEVIETEHFAMEDVEEETFTNPVDNVTVIEEKPTLVAVKTKKKMKCHLCPKTGFSSTHNFVAHLQKHISDEKQCKRCLKRVSCDSRPICIRRGVCETCFVA